MNLSEYSSNDDGTVKLRLGRTLIPAVKQRARVGFKFDGVQVVISLGVSKSIFDGYFETVIIILIYGCDKIQRVR